MRHGSFIFVLQSLYGSFLSVAASAAIIEWFSHGIGREEKYVIAKKRLPELGE